MKRASSRLMSCPQCGLEGKEQCYLALNMRLMGVETNFVSYGMAKVSHNIFLSSENHRAVDVPLVNYLLYCLSIELGLKASILRLDNSKKRKDYLKYKIGHDLQKLLKDFEKCSLGRDVLDEADRIALGQINPYYKNKGLEFITSELQVALLKGMSDFPNLGVLRLTAVKVDDLLKSNEFYIND